MAKKQMIDVVLLAMLPFCLCAVRTEAATYYVSNKHATASDNNSGTVDSPFKTIAAGVARTKPGDTVVIEAGDYGREEIEIKGASETAQKGIVIKAQKPGTVILQGNPTPRNENNGVAFRLSLVSYLTIEGLLFKYYETGISIADSEHITVRNCTFESNASSGVSNWASHNTLVEECRFLDPHTPTTANHVAIQDYGVNFYHSNNCVVTNCYFFGKHNQACSWKQDCHGGLITGCVFEGALYTGIYLGQNYLANGRPPCSNLRAEYNIVRNAKGYRLKSPIRVGNCVNATVSFSYLETSHETKTTGEEIDPTGAVYIYPEARGNVVISNNIFAYGITYAVDLGSYGVDVGIFNNTFYKCPRAVAENRPPVSVTATDNIAFKTPITWLLAKNASNYVGDPQFVGPLAQLPQTATPTPISYKEYWKKLTARFALRVDSPARGKGADTGFEISDAKRVLQLLTRARDDRSVIVPAAAFSTAGRDGRIEAIKAIEEAMLDADSNVRWRATLGLRELRTAEALPLLQKALANDSADIRRSALQALAKVGGPRTLPLVKTALEDSDKYVRESAVYALRDISATEIIPLVQKALADQEHNVRVAAVLLLGKLGGAQVVEQFKAPLGDDHPDVRRAAIVALGMIGGRKAGDLLMARADVEEDERVRRALRLCILANFRNHPGRE